MVTMPSEAADDPALVQHLVQNGMNVMRVNCAHDDAARWLRMIENLRRAEATLGVKCLVFMDLAGPKLRTGPLAPGPAVIKVRPDRDPRGRVLAPARLWFTHRDDPHPPPTAAGAVVRVSRAWLAGLQQGDRIAFRDARDARRRLRIVDVTDAGCWAELSKTAYLVPGTRLVRDGDAVRGPSETEVGDLPALELGIRLVQGDALLIGRTLDVGRQATYDKAGRLLTPPVIGCTIPQVFEDVRVGEPIWFDDGRIGGIIEQVSHDHLHIRVTHAPPGGATLRSDKGINLPETRLRLSALTPKDVADLTFVAQHADVVELSFANAAADVELLQRHLEQLGARRPPIVLKIETRRGFEHLPEMLLCALRQPTCGVMIARGDLAVECGFERLAEVQEEILWICEAAHVPVIWATQVLELLAKNGMASRAEITDAAMGHRAECVMLNKGPHVVTAVRTLDDILRRMQAHHAKKRSMLRELRLAHALDSP
jgi:pyruvate kinase